MKHVRKGAQPLELASWRSAIRPRGSIPPWNSCPDQPNEILREALSREQLLLCCYCTGSIARGNFHIEHFCPRNPQTGNRALTYVWKNLLASCQGGGGDALTLTRKYCGAGKEDWYQPGVTTDPRVAGVEALFRFSLTGKIYPAKQLTQAAQDAVKLTITKLGLDAPSLIQRRFSILSQAASDTLILNQEDWFTRYLGIHGDQLQEFWPALHDNYIRTWKPNIWPNGS